MSYGVVIARFQVAALTPGHQHILDTARDKHDGNLLILLGDCTEKPSKRYPLPFYVREEMVRASYEHAIILPINDLTSDHKWSATVDSLIETAIPTQDLKIYGGRDSFIQQYHGKFRTEYVAARIDWASGTAVRDFWAGNTTNSEEFRAGMLHAAALHETWSLLGKK